MATTHMSTIHGQLSACFHEVNGIFLKGEYLHKVRILHDLLSQKSLRQFLCLWASVQPVRTYLEHFKVTVIGTLCLHLQHIFQYLEQDQDMTVCRGWGGMELLRRMTCGH